MSNQQNLLSQFIEITGVDESRAKFYLESSGWDLNVSLTILGTIISRSKPTKHQNPLYQMPFKLHRYLSMVHLFTVSIQCVHTCNKIILVENLCILQLLLASPLSHQSLSSLSHSFFFPVMLLIQVLSL